MHASQYQNFANSAHPLNWYEVAKLMHRNAQALHNMPLGKVSYREGVHSLERSITNRSVFLLAAFALENLVKAFLIYENPQYIEGGKLSRHLLNAHGLSALQRRSRNVPSPKRTRHVFETLETGVNSWARYPCATSIERESQERAVTPELWESYCDVFNLYSQKLEQLLSRPWKGPYGESGYVTFR